jgi:hypothetical protein
MKNLLVMFIVMLGLCFSQAETKTTLWNANEFGPVVYGAYDLDNHNFGVGAGLQLFPAQKYLGIEGSTTLYDTHDKFIDNISGDVILRLPIDSLNVAPFVTAGVKYDFNNQKVEPTIGGGGELRFNSKWGLVAKYERLLQRNDGIAKLGIALKF